MKVDIPCSYVLEFVDALPLPHISLALAYTSLALLAMSWRSQCEYLSIEARMWVMQ